MNTWVSSMDGVGGPLFPHHYHLCARRRFVFFQVVAVQMTTLVSGSSREDLQTSLGSAALPVNLRAALNDLAAAAASP